MNKKSSYFYTSTVIILIVVLAIISIFLNGGRLVPFSGQVYENSDKSFSFHYPEEMGLQTFDEQDGKTILLGIDNVGAVIQIFVVSPVPEDLVVTKEALQQQLSSINTNSYEDIRVTSAKISAVYFSTTESFGEAGNIWFANKGKLFQLVFYKDYRDKVMEILKSLSF